MCDEVRDWKPSELVQWKRKGRETSPVKSNLIPARPGASWRLDRVPRQQVGEECPLITWKQEDHARCAKASDLQPGAGIH